MALELMKKYRNKYSQKRQDEGEISAFIYLFWNEYSTVLLSLIGHAYLFFGWVLSGNGSSFGLYDAAGIYAPLLGPLAFMAWAPLLYFVGDKLVTKSTVKAPGRALLASLFWNTAIIAGIFSGFVYQRDNILADYGAAGASSADGIDSPLSKQSVADVENSTYRVFAAMFVMLVAPQVFQWIGLSMSVAFGKRGSEKRTAKAS